MTLYTLAALITALALSHRSRQRRRPMQHWSGIDFAHWAITSAFWPAAIAAAILPRRYAARLDLLFGLFYWRIQNSLTRERTIRSIHNAQGTDA